MQTEAINDMNDANKTSKMQTEAINDMNDANKTSKMQDIDNSLLNQNTEIIDETTISSKLKEAYLSSDSTKESNSDISLEQKNKTIIDIAGATKYNVSTREITGPATYRLLDFQDLQNLELQKLTYKEPEQEVKKIVTYSFPDSKINEIKFSEIKNEYNEIACITAQKGNLKAIIIQQDDNDIILKINKANIEIQNNMLKVDFSNCKEIPFDQETIDKMNKATRIRAEYEELRNNIATNDNTVQYDNAINEKLLKLETQAKEATQEAIELSQQAIGLSKQRDLGSTTALLDQGKATRKKFKKVKQNVLNPISINTAKSKISSNVQYIKRRNRNISKINSI